METIKVKQSGAIGDLILSLSAAHQAHVLHNKPIDFYVGFFEPNVVPNHPSGKYCMNDNTYNYIKPLLQHQTWINSVQKHKKQEVDYDFDMFRHVGLNLGAHDLRLNHFAIYPQLAINHNISKPVIQHSEDLEFFKDKIVINLTTRYRNTSINYAMLEPLKDYLVFVGNDEEYKMFNRNCISGVYRVKVKDALHMANIVASCRVLICNQSSTYAISEQLKTPRLLEIYNPVPNSVPLGGIAYGYYTNEGLKYYLSQIGLQF